MAQISGFPLSTLPHHVHPPDCVSGVPSPFVSLRCWIRPHIPLPIVWTVPPDRMWLPWAQTKGEHETSILGSQLLLRWKREAVWEKQIFPKSRLNIWTCQVGVSWRSTCMLKSVLFKGELITQRPGEPRGWKAGFRLSVRWALLPQTELARPPSLWVCVCIFFFPQCTAPKSQGIIFKGF